MLQKMVDHMGLGYILYRDADHADSFCERCKQAYRDSKIIDHRLLLSRYFRRKYVESFAKCIDNPQMPPINIADHVRRDPEDLDNKPERHKRADFDRRYTSITIETVLLYDLIMQRLKTLCADCWNLGFLASIPPYIGHTEQDRHNIEERLHGKYDKLSLAHFADRWQDMYDPKEMAEKWAAWRKAEHERLDVLGYFMQHRLHLAEMKRLSLDCTHCQFCARPSVRKFDQEILACILSSCFFVEHKPDVLFPNSIMCNVEGAVRIGLLSERYDKNGKPMPEIVSPRNLCEIKQCRSGLYMKVRGDKLFEHVRGLIQWEVKNWQLCERVFI